MKMINKFVPFTDTGCKHHLYNEPTKCFSFQIPHDVDVVDVNSAQLWIYKKHDAMDEHNQTFIISDVAHWDTSRKFTKRNPIAVKETDIKEDWVKIDLEWPVKNWFQFHDLTHVVDISCVTCHDKNKSPIYRHSEKTPFIVIDTYTQRQRHRQKRQLECSAGINECCREKLYLNFADIGWNDWILYPKGYHAYFCRGNCESAASIALTNAPHTSILRVIFKT